MMSVSLVNEQIRIKHLQIFATNLLGWVFSPCFHSSFQVTHLEIKHTTFIILTVKELSGEMIIGYVPGEFPRKDSSASGQYRKNISRNANPVAHQQ
jgi:hypothetical protein